MPFISSKETARKPGSLTTGDTDKVLLVGPSAPATKRGLAGSGAGGACGAGVEVGVADLAHDVGPRQVQKVVVALLIVVEGSPGAEAFFVEAIALDHRAVRPVLHQ